MKIKDTQINFSDPQNTVQPHSGENWQLQGDTSILFVDQSQAVSHRKILRVSYLSTYFIVIILFIITFISCLQIVYSKIFLHQHSSHQ